MALTDTNDVRQLGAKIEARLLASGNLTIDLSFAYQKLDIDDSFNQTSPGVKRPADQIPGVVPVSLLNLDNTELKIFNATLQYDFGAVSLISATSYFDGTKDSLSDINHAVKAFFSPGTEGNAQQQSYLATRLFTQELRLVSNGDERFDWTIGGFYKNMDRDLDEGFLFQFTSFIPEIVFLGPPFGGVLNENLLGHLESRVESYALFAEASYELSGAFTVTVGGRYFSDDRSLTNETVEGSPNIFGSVTGALDSPVLGEDSTFSPNVILSWEVQEDVLVFAKVSKGFRSGGVNIANFTNAGAPADYQAKHFGPMKRG